MRIGIDAGGTFTDFIVVRDNGTIETFKLRSNPRSPASVILAGLEQAAGGTRADVIHIGRQNRAELYNLTPQLRAPIIPRAMCFGVRERAYFDGAIAQSPSGA